MSSAVAHAVEPSRGEASARAKSLTHVDLRPRSVEVPPAPGSKRPLRSRLLHSTGELFGCPAAWAAAEEAARDDVLAARFSCPPENEHYLRKLPDGRKVPLEFEEQVEQTIAKLGREGRLPPHPGMKRHAIVRVVAAAACADEGAGGRASIAWLAYKADLSPRHTRDVAKYAITAGLLDRFRCDRVRDWVGAPPTAYRDRRSIWIVHLVPREIAQTISDDALFDYAAKGDRVTARPLPVSSWKPMSTESTASSATTPSSSTATSENAASTTEDESTAAEPKGPSVGSSPTRSSSAAHADAPRPAAPPVTPFRPASVRALRPELATLPALLEELARATKKGIFLDPLDIATLGTAAPPDGCGLSAEMLLKTVEEMIAKILSGATYARKADHYAWTLNSLRSRLHRFFEQKKKDLDKQKEEEAKEDEQQRANEDLAAGLRRAGEQRAAAERAAAVATPEVAGSDACDACDPDGGDRAPMVAAPAATAAWGRVEARLALAPTGDIVLDRALEATRRTLDIARVVAGHAFDHWFHQVQIDGLEGGVLVVRAANAFVLDFLGEKILPALAQQIRAQGATCTGIRTTVDDAITTPVARPVGDVPARGPPT